MMPFDVVVFTEHQKAVPHARDFGRREGYDVSGAPTDTLLMGRNVTGHEWHAMEQGWWWGPALGRLHKRKPRTYESATMDGTPVLGLHNVPGGPGGAWSRTRGRNKAAWHESAAFVRQWLEEHPDGIVVGDFNAKAREVRKHMLPDGAGYANTGKVDGVAFGRNLTPTGKKARHGLPGHGAGVVTITNR